MPKQFETRQAAEAAIADAIRAGRIESGRAQVNFSGYGGRTVYMAHVRTAGGLSFCLREG